MILEVIYYKEKIKIIFIGYYLTINDTSKFNSRNYTKCLLITNVSHHNIHSVKFLI